MTDIVFINNCFPCPCPCMKQHSHGSVEDLNEKYSPSCE